MKANTLYQQTQLNDARPEDILLRLMEGAIRNVRAAQSKWDEHHQGPAREHLIRTLDIVMELDSSLDRNREEELVEQLDALYAFMIRELTEVNQTGEIQRLASVQNILETLYQGWREAAGQVQASPGEMATAESPAPTG
jgi:flagellar protein FliS